MKKLGRTQVQLDGKIVEIEHKLLFTMIDGKVCNAISGNKSTQKCFLCKASAKEFNDIDKNLKRTVTDTLLLEFGLSTLHRWIRCFECLLHIAYKLPIKK